MDTSQYLTMFVDESMEHLDTLYQQLLELEQNPTDKTIIEEIFRAAHTLKGMSATMNYSDLAHLTHALENVFDGIRYDRIAVHTDIMDHLLGTVDHMNAMVEDIANGGDGARNVEDTIHLLEEIEQGKLINGNDEASKNSSASLSVNTLDEFQLTILQESLEQGYENVQVTIHIHPDCLLKGVRAFMVFEVLEQCGEIIHTNPSVQEIEEENFDTSFSIIMMTKEPIEEVEAKLYKVSEIEHVECTPFSVEDYLSKRESIIKETTTPTSQSDSSDKANSKQPKQAVASKTIRVDIERLDTLMNLFEELVIDRGRLEQISLEVNNADLRETVERMSRVSSDLQNIILTMRMVPIDTVFNRFPRMIRQLARELEKEVEIDIVGADTELDRTVIDEIGDPLVHLIRNAIDHGIETPDERVQKGKPKKGKVTLEAYHSGNHVFVEITDDGAGIDQDKVKRKAVEKGVISEADAHVLTDQQSYELILASGFSTNEEVSDVSGRGVGLDVVKNTIESLGGSISIDAIPGQQSNFMIQLPLTLSIISVLLVELEDEKYAIPLSSIIEATIVHKNDIYSAHHQKVIDFRGNVVPITDLNNIFDIDKAKGLEDEYISIVIVRKGNKLTGLVVDSLIGQQEIVLKSLGDYLTNIYAISGATILGNGEVALIIDTNTLIK